MTARSSWGSETDPDEFTAFVIYWHGRLRKSVSRKIYTPSRVEREDLADHIVEEVFLALDRAWSSTDPAERERLMFSIAKTLVTQETGRWRIASDRRRDAYYLLARLEFESDGSEGDCEDADKGLDDVDDLGLRPDPRRVRFEELLVNLPRRQREAVTHQLAGLTYTQIAEKMAITIGAAKANVSFAKTKLKKLIEESDRIDRTIADGGEEDDS